MGDNGSTKLEPSSIESSQPRTLADVLMADWKMIVLAWAIAISMLLQTSYWNWFGVNAQEYMGLQDFATATLPMLVLGVIGAAAVLGFADQAANIVDVFRLIFRPIFRSWVRKSEDLTFESARVLTKEQFFQYRMTIIFVTIMLAIYPVVLSITQYRGFQFIAWGVLPGLFAVYTIALFTRFVDLVVAKFDERWLDGPFLSLQRISFDLLAVLLAVSPSYAIATGMYRAMLIGSGAAYNRALPAGEEVHELCGRAWPEDARHLGHINDYDFFLLNEGTCIVRSDQLPSFVLTRIEDPNPLAALRRVKHHPRTVGVNRGGASAVP